MDDYDEIESRRFLEFLARMQEDHQRRQPLLDVLKNTAELEHECELLPHTDPDLKAVCPICVGKPRFEPPEYDYVLS